MGSPQGSDFPAALLRFCACLGIQVAVCAPQHPQENGFVERYKRSSQEECLAVDQPRDVPEAQAASEAFVEHYHVERPHQGLACGHRPPRTAFPTLPALPPLPSTVDPDHWLQSRDGLHLERKIDRHGMLSIDLKRYSVSRQLAGHRVSVQLDAGDCCLHVSLEEHRIKSLPLRGLLGQLLSCEQFLAPMLQQARAQHRLRSLQQRRWRSSPFTTP